MGMTRPLPAYFMDIAMAEARAAALRGEVPVGAALAGPQGQVLARAGNRVEEWHDPSAHAEMQVMRAATRLRGGQRLADCTLYVTLEPCPMCAAAAVHFRIGRIVFGAYDPKGGGVEHGPRVFAQPRCLHRPETVGGVREREAGALLRDFFAHKRA
ncbi:nucleoside deaminase [Komagataeibacter sucrofermentans]|uniref:tRNA-specific adenosine deaminase n=1 Tax=Komagataeibacter sucrofermentans TaxID=1053551 RepID=A0A318QQK3_9PROT|nr:nucleoside deaminase [Komagataeibacter sucrofermentans]PYD79728.1 tRNA-specific adenosine deaminase [Komagataeibacter sucrofermentans]GBQ44187.1 cytosine deaminase [Komagataeibacter sucrofermentans DSM 15973]